MTPLVALSGSPQQDITTPTPPRILIMDDNPNLRYIYTQALQEEGYEAYPVATLQEAHDLISTYTFDIFLADTHIGDTAQGAVLLKENYITFLKNNTKIVMISFNDQYQSICEEMGTDAFIEKPVSVGRLVSIINRLVAQRIQPS